MNPIYKQFVDGIVFTQNLKIDIENFLNCHNENETFQHTIKVATEASRTALLFDADPELAEQAGLLHDVSNVIPITKMMSIAKELSIEKELNE
jgi:HD superfamily phosphohydrolase YqeK